MIRPLAAGMLGLALGVALGVPLAGQQPPAPSKSMPDAGHAHADLYYSAPPDRQGTLFAVSDDRYKDEPLVVSPLDTPDGPVMVREGDEVVGRAHELIAWNLARYAAMARLIDPEEPSIRESLGGGRRELLMAVRRIHRGDDADFSRQMAESKIAPWVNNVVSLVSRLEGQTDLFPPDLVAAVRAIRANPRSSGVGIVGAQYRWPGAVVPYVIRLPGVPVAEAVAHWNEATPITLRPRQQGDRAWLEFVAAQGCSSYIGKCVADGPQYVMLGQGCLFDQVVHEIGHAIGLFHEQSRLDRDRYLIVEPSNVMRGTEDNFSLVRVGLAQDLGDFDFDSVMLYGPDAFTMNGRPTMVARDPSVGTAWGINHRGRRGLRGLSKGDVAAVEAMYPRPLVPQGGRP